MSETIEGTFQLTTNQMDTLRAINRKVTAEFDSAEFEPGVAGDGRGVIWVNSVTCGETSYEADFTSLEKIILKHQGGGACRHLPRNFEIAYNREIFSPLMRLFQSLDTEFVQEPSLEPLPSPPPLEPIPPDGWKPQGADAPSPFTASPEAPGLDPNFKAPPLPDDDDEGFPWWGWAGIAAGVAALAGGVAWALTSQENPEPPPVGETSTQPVATGTTSGVGQRGGRGDR